MTYDKPIKIQRQNADSEEWETALELHARVNKTGGGAVLRAGADQYRAHLTFEVRYIAALEEIAYSPQPYRILYRGKTFKVVDYDDYMEQHRTVRLKGELYE